MDLIQEVITTSTQASVSFLAVPQIYRDLVVIARGRGTRATPYVDILLQFNYDTAGAYFRQHLEGAGTVVGALASTTLTGCDMGPIPGASATANYSGAARATVFNYRDTTFFKTCTSHAGASSTNTATGQTVQIDNSMWLSLAPIDHIVVLPIGGNFVDGSVISLYGQH
jgi:hypothetical protein